MILCFGGQLSLEEPKAFILSKNLALALVDTEIVDKKLLDNLKSSKVEKVPHLISLFIFTPLGFVPQYDEGWKKIHNFSHPIGHSINNYISNSVGKMRYARF